MNTKTNENYFYPVLSYLQKRRVFIILTLFLFFFLLSGISNCKIYAAEEDKFFIQNITWEIGKGYFYSSGFGVSIHHWFSPNIGFSSNFLFYSILDEYEYRILLGIEFDYRFRIYEKSAIYAYISANSDLFLSTYSSVNNEFFVDFGLGIGFQWMFFKHLTSHIHIGYGFYNFTKTSLDYGIGFYYAI